MTIPDETYRRLASRAASLNITVEQLLTAALEQAAGSESSKQDAHPCDLPNDLWKAQFDRLVALVESRANRYPPGFQADVSRDSIYEGCGE